MNELPSKLSAGLHSGVIVLTGGIASGKSAAAGMFRDLGATIVDADEIAREVVAPGTPGLSAVLGEFGSRFRGTDGGLDRSALGRLIFSEPDARARLEAILHPLIRDRADERFGHALAGGAPLVIYDCPLYFEGDLVRLGFGGVIVVWAPTDQCIERLIRRSALVGEPLTEAQARARIDAQLSLGEKRKRADWVLDNSGSREDLEAQVRALYPQLLERVSGRTNVPGDGVTR